MQTSVLGHEGTMSVVKLEECRERIRKELDNVVDFWLKYSHDTTHGGFFTCIGRDGKVYDELKYVWLQGRQVWMYCRLYRTMDRFHKPEILEAAKAGGAFLRKFARVSSGSSGQLKCAFCLTRDGKAVKIQRTIFSECFYVMAMDELSRVIGDKDMQLEAEQMMEQLIYWVKVDSSGLGHPQLPGDVPTNSMAVPMMLLCLVQQLTEGRGQEVVQKYSELASWCVQQILQHIQRDGTAILENVSLEGAELPGCSGRLQNPGHALEAGWFLLQLSREQENEELQRTAINKFVELPYQCGWDKEHGGLFYFLDVDGHCPTQLEWNMKLWWPHCEALIAFLMAYNQTKKPELLERFSEVYEYTFKHALIVIIVSGIMERVSLKEKSCSEIWRGDVLLEDNGGIVEYLHDGNASDSRAELARVYGYSDFTTRLTLEQHLDAKTNPIKRKFPDAKSGEWFGYLTQEGKVALDLKGGPFKGFFHVPRCLYMCERILDDLLVNKEGGCNNGIESDLSVH